MTQNKRLVQRLGLLTALSFIAAGCASTPKADIAANANPNDEITRLHTDLANGESNDFAVLDQKDFMDSRDHLASAEDKLKNNKSPEDVLNEIRISRGYYNRADKMANERRSHIQTVLDSREQAISAGAAQYPQSRNDLNDADKDARDLAESNDTPSSEKIMKLQKKYADVQLVALEAKNLGTDKATIDAAKDQNASSKAPKTLNQAKVDYDNAKMAISTNRSSPGVYAGAVKQANLSADTLARVMEMARKNDKNFNEDEAVRIVEQDRRIHSLDNQVGDQQAQNQALSAQQAQLKDTLSAQQQTLRENNKKIALQKALTDAQAQFSNNEAEVYQKDNQLLIRLKSVAFDTGSYKIPSKSLDILAKVQTVVQGLKPDAIDIQGHTDSTGTKAKNEELSEKRAEAVASYFEKNGVDASKIKSEGYGDEKPLASNKTKEGRSENRRIDILVTPSDQL